MTYTATINLKSRSPYGQSRYHGILKKERETHAAHEDRTWKDKMSVDDDGYVFIQPMAFKKGLVTTAQYVSVQIPGQGKKTYTKKIQSGIMFTEKLVTDVHETDIQKESFFVPSDGKTGPRVFKHFPYIREWEGSLACTVLDEIVTPEVLHFHMERFGQFIGVGRFRPENGGFYGRFEIVSITTDID